MPEPSSRARIDSAISPALVVAYAALIFTAEAVFVFDGVFAGMVAHIAVFALLLFHYAAACRIRECYPVLPSLALIPLLRILSIAIPTPVVPEMYWYVLIGAPLLLGVAAAARSLDLGRRDLQLTLRNTPLQIGIAVTGIPLGLLVYLLIRPTPTFIEHGWQAILLGGLILFLFSGLTEEILFRGMLQPRLIGAIGPMGIVVTNVLFTAVYMGSRAPGYVLLVWLVGISFGWLAYRTGSILGVGGAHGSLTAGVLLVWPSVSSHAHWLPML